MKLRLVLALSALALGLVASPLSANPQPIPLVQNWAITPNLTPLSFSERSVPTSGPESNFINSDLAFWGDMVVQGHYNGFRLVDVSQPKKPTEIIDYEECAPKNPTGAVPGNQGDIAIYGDISAARGTRTRGRPARPATATSSHRGSSGCTSSTSRTNKTRT